jgi:hypothetical protein
MICCARNLTSIYNKSLNFRNCEIFRIDDVIILASLYINPYTSINICLESCNPCPQAMRLFNETYGKKKTERGRGDIDQVI